ncbi:hypothetical protein [Halococcus hamelinensis]|uniref:Uncharacterized protein n=1 Tax=Halococcus hamelinensis 100A6 TaxID=1132509 RepID=M0M798_9EURY|nr:hypothetical protein [Halococcus hamelinensis]EMA41273.1 hypothetical protein C447_02472 [Halococcus hamelinensis 100A6]
MNPPETPPERLSERELFTELVDLLDESDDPEGYTEARFRARRAALLAEVGDRLETLEAVKSLLEPVGTPSDGVTEIEMESDREP